MAHYSVILVGVIILMSPLVGAIADYEHDGESDTRPMEGGHPNAMKASHFNGRDKYEPITFDLVHRGTFNMSQCSMAMFNCWELVSPPVAVCTKWETKDITADLCTTMRQSCREWDAFDDDRFAVKIREGHCNTWEPFGMGRRAMRRGVENRGYHERARRRPPTQYTPMTVKMTGVDTW